MSKGLRNTIASVAFASMGLLGSAKIAHAEGEDAYIEMAKILEKNTDNKRAYHQMDYSYELYDMQLALPEVITNLVKINGEIIDFAEHPKFSIKICERGNFIKFDDDSKIFAQITPFGRLIKTKQDPKKIFNEMDGRTVKIDAEEQTFSMVWLDEFGVDPATTVSPVLSFNTPKQVSKKVTTNYIKRLMGHTK